MLAASVFRLVFAFLCLLREWLFEFWAFFPFVTGIFHGKVGDKRDGEESLVEVMDEK